MKKLDAILTEIHEMPIAKYGIHAGKSYNKFVFLVLTKDSHYHTKKIHMNVFNNIDMPEKCAHQVVKKNANSGTIFCNLQLNEKGYFEHYNEDCYVLFQKENIILGGGVAGLISGYYSKNFIIVDPNRMGQLNTSFIPGPRIFYDTKNIRKFLDSLNIDYFSKKIFVGYEDENCKLVNLTEDFKEKYSLITRNTKKVEKSFLSSGKSEFNILTDGSDDFYSKVFEKLYNIMKKNILLLKVTEIDILNKVVKCENFHIHFENCISTINLVNFCKLSGLSNISPVLLQKTFVKCEYNKTIDIELSKKYSYLYSINGIYTRKTYFSDYIVYEMVNPIDASLTQIEGNKIIQSINAPVQIQNSLDIRNIGGVEMIGRFSQWNHNIKAEQIINKFLNK